MLRWIWLVPPQIVSLRLKKNALTIGLTGYPGRRLSRMAPGHEPDRRAGIDEHRRRAEHVERQLHGLLVHLAPEHLVRCPERRARRDPSRPTALPTTTATR